MTPLYLADSSGAIFAVSAPGLAAEIRSEGDLLDPYLLDRLAFTPDDYARIHHDPASPLGLELLDVRDGGCEWCDGRGTYSGPCEYRIDERGWYAWGPSSDPDASDGQCACAECRGTGRRYSWTGVHLTPATLAELLARVGETRNLQDTEAAS